MPTGHERLRGGRSRRGRDTAVPASRVAAAPVAPRSRLLLVCILLAAVVMPGLLRAADAPQAVELVLQESWQAFFGGHEAVLHIAVRNGPVATLRLGWTLRAGPRTVLSAERALEGTADQPARVELPLRLPPVKEGVILPLDLEVQAMLPGEPAAVVTLSRRLWLFPDDPFANRTEWLQGLRLRLFDPEGLTEKCLTQAQVPFESVTNLAALEGEAPVVLIVGAGTSARTYEDSALSLLRLAAQGHRVLTLTVTGAEFALPGTADLDLPPPLRVEWRQADVITDLDKRLDSTAWPPDGTLTPALLQIATRGAQVTGRVGTEAPGWPWVAAQFATGGRFVVCGFPMIERWEAGPTPRFLFARILEWLTPSEKTESGQEKGETKP